MEQNNAKVRDLKSHPAFVMPDLTRGLYHANTINKSPETVYEFLKTETNITKVLKDIPEDLKNFLELKLSSSESTQVKYINKPDAKIQGELTFKLSPGPAGKGTVLSAQAIFGDYTSKDENPSDLINVFLKRIKAMVETGVLATTKGQPNGKDNNEEIKH